MSAIYPAMFGVVLVQGLLLVVGLVMRIRNRRRLVRGQPDIRFILAITNALLGVPPALYFGRLAWVFDFSGNYPVLFMLSVAIPAIHFFTSQRPKSAN